MPCNYGDFRVRRSVPLLVLDIELDPKTLEIKTQPSLKVGLRFRRQVGGVEIDEIDVLRGMKMATFKIPTLNTDRLRLRAFEANDLDAYAAMQANPEVMRYLVTGRTYSSEVWASSSHSTGLNRRSPIRSTAPSGGRVSRPRRRGRLATGCSGNFPCRELPASFDPTIRPQSASRNGLARFANAHSSCAVPAMNIGCITGPRHTLIAQDKNVSRAAQNRPSLHNSSFAPFTRSDADDWS
jgi:hypothetical protein